MVRRRGISKRRRSRTIKRYSNNHQGVIVFASKIIKKRLFEYLKNLS